MPHARGASYRWSGDEAAANELAVGASSPPLILLRSPLLGADLEAALLASGREVVPVNASELSLASLRQLAARGATCLLGVNHAPPLALLCREAGLAYVSWTIDPLPLERWTLVEGTRSFLFVHRKALVEPLLRMGHAHVEWLPLAAPARRWSDPLPARGGMAPLFVGSSLQDERKLFTSRLETWGLGGTLDALVSFLDSMAAMAERNRDFRGFLVQPQTLPASLVQALEGRVERADLAEAMDAGLAWRYRRMQVAHLAGKGMEVRGDGGWLEVVGERWKGPLLNGRDMTRAYREAALNLDVPRSHQREIVTLRAFDVLASGGLLMAESGTELEDLFRPGMEFIAWTSPEERDEWLDAAFAGGGAKLDAIAQAGREAAWEHRLDVRVRRILEAVDQFD
jgi:hypothetical protein